MHYCTKEREGTIAAIKATKPEVLAPKDEMLVALAIVSVTISSLGMVLKYNGMPVLTL